MRGSNRPVVLVVDDGKQHVMLLRLALMQRGYAVVVVHSEEGARTMTRERPVDALVVTLAPEAASATLHGLGEARPRLAVGIADVASDPAYASFDAVLSRPVDFGELDIMLRERLRRRTSGTRARVSKRGAA